MAVLFDWCHYFWCDCVWVKDSRITYRASHFKYNTVSLLSEQTIDFQPVLFLCCERQSAGAVLV